MAMKSAIVYVIAAGNVCRFEPISVFLLDLVAIRVAADGAFSGVALDVRRKFFVFIERLFRARDYVLRQRCERGLRCNRLFHFVLLPSVE